jgi:phage recombination protein Bet
MSNALTVAGQANSGMNLVSYTEEQFGILKNSVTKNFTDIEFATAIAMSKRKNLDLLTGQMFAIKRKSWNKELEKWEETITFQTSIDGYRIIADRTGLYEGQTMPEWCGEDGIWRDVWTAKVPPVAARVGVLRRGFKEPVYAIALFSEYVQIKDEYNTSGEKTGKKSPTKFWKEKPASMLLKCAESLALRKAFTENLQGLYTNEEMEQADNSKPLNAESEIIGEGKLTEALPPDNLPKDNPYKINLGGSQPAKPTKKKEDWKQVLYKWLCTLPDQSKVSTVISEFCNIADLYRQDYRTLNAIMMKLSATFDVFAPSLEFDGEV